MANSSKRKAEGAVQPEPGWNTAAALARHFGVSRAAVSYALNGRPGLSPELRKEILAEATRRGIPIKTAQDPTDKALLGLILADIGNAFYSEFAVSASDAARRRGFEVILSHTDDEPKAIQSSVRAMLNHGVTGLMLTVVNTNDCSLGTLVRGAKLPCVQVSRRAKHFQAGFVGVDDFRAGHEVMAHMLAHGYTDVCIAAGPKSSSSSMDRALGMMKALSDRGMRVRPDRLLFTRLSVEGGKAVARHLLSRGKLPQAVVCGTDSIALGLINTLMRAGVRCPEDIAISGYDGLVLSQLGMIDLTTVVQPREEMATAAVNLLIEAQDDPTLANRSIHCGHRLSVGHTCGCAAQDRMQQSVDAEEADADTLNELRRMNHECTTPR